MTEAQREEIHRLVTAVFADGGSNNAEEAKRQDAAIILGTTVIGALLRLADAQERMAKAAEDAQGGF